MNGNGSLCMNNLLNQKTYTPPPPDNFDDYSSQNHYTYWKHEVKKTLRWWMSLIHFFYRDYIRGILRKDLCLAIDVG